MLSLEYNKCSIYSQKNILIFWDAQVHLTHTCCWDPAGFGWCWCWCLSFPCTWGWWACSCSPGGDNPHKFLNMYGDVWWWCMTEREIWKSVHQCASWDYRRSCVQGKWQNEEVSILGFFFFKHLLVPLAGRWPSSQTYQCTARWYQALRAPQPPPLSPHRCHLNINIRIDTEHSLSIQFWTYSQCNSKAKCRRNMLHSSDVENRSYDFPTGSYLIWEKFNSEIIL